MTTGTVLDREEYIEQAYFFRVLRERLESGQPTQDVLERIDQEILSITRLPYAIQFLAAERSPETLIVDISGVEMPAARMQELAEVCEPGVTVIAIGDHNDVAVYRDLVHAGVHDYLVKPISPQALAGNWGRIGKPAECRCCWRTRPKFGGPWRWFPAGHAEQSKRS